MNILKMHGPLKVKNTLAGIFSLHLIKNKAPMTNATCKCCTEGSFPVSKERKAYNKSLLITIRSRLLIEKLILPHLGKNFPNLMETQGCLAYLQGSRMSYLFLFLPFLL